MPYRPILSVITLKREFVEAKVKRLQMAKTVLMAKVNALDYEAVEQLRRNQHMDDIHIRQVLSQWQKWRQDIQAGLRAEIQGLDVQILELATELKALIAQHEFISVKQDAVNYAKEQDIADRESEQSLTVWSQNRV